MTATAYTYTYNAPQIQQGWECPRCGQINAPWINHCTCTNGNWYITCDYKEPYWKNTTADTFKIHPESDPIYTIIK